MKTQWRRIRALFRNHTTKMIGYAQVIAGVLATSSVMPPKGAGWCALIGGLITALRGHQNTRAANTLTLQPKE